ncbi:MAG: hypothetical protein KME19_00080 [Microcoleus vaginatus WJT46-NPBG5]|nr:hypothetical protein [Microcoleus vaginatus WJT46-NPBG5]
MATTRIEGHGGLGMGHWGLGMGHWALLLLTHSALSTHPLRTQHFRLSLPKEL